MLIYKNSFVGILITAACVVGLILVASTLSLQKGQIAADATAVVVGITAEAKRVEVQATLVAEQAKAAQLREEYEGKVKLIEAGADAYAEKSNADNLTYLIRKSEERQDGLIYYLQTGKALADEQRDADRKTTNLIVGVVVAVIVLFGLALVRER